MTIERVTFKAPGAKRAQTIFIENAREAALLGASMLTGAEVARDGGTKWFGKGDTQRTHIIDLGTVTKRVVVTMNNDWGLLVGPDGEPA